MWFYPGSDLHVVRAFAPLSFRVAVHDGWGRGGAWVDPSTVENMAVTFGEYDKTPATVHHAIANFLGSPHDPLDPLAPGAPRTVTVAASAVSGTSIFFATVLSPGATPAVRDHGIFRVSTHDDVAMLFAGDNGVHMFAGESNRVIAVFAEFSDGVVAEVTGHNWLAATTDDPAIATIDAEGRITAVAPGAALITVKTSDGRYPFNVHVTVLPSLANGFGTRAISDQVRVKKPRTNTTLFVLSEGYMDAARFHEHAVKLIDECLATSPYKDLGDRFSAVSIFVAAPERGITIGSGLAPGTPGDPSSRDYWSRTTANGQVRPLPQTFLRTRDTLIGVIFGERLARPNAPLNQLTGLSYTDSYFEDLAPQRQLGVDDRRLPRFGIDLPVGATPATTFAPIPPEAAFASFLRRYIQAAGYTTGPRDRVVVLVDDDFYGGLHIDVISRKLDTLPTVAVSVGRELQIRPVTGVSANPPIMFDRAPSVPMLDRVHVQKNGATLAHELGHSYRLGDEYQEASQADADRFAPAPFEAYDNVQHAGTLRRAAAGASDPLRGNATTPVALDPARIKWNILHRVAKASPTLSISDVTTAFRLQLEINDAWKWMVGDAVFVRSLALPWTTTTPNNAPRFKMFATTITARDLLNDTVDVAIPAGGFAIDGMGAPVLYVPKIDPTHGALTLVDPAVVAYLAAHGPFPKVRPCVDTNADHGMNKDQFPPNIAGFRFPAVQARAIGLYEGGADFACNVFRGAGRCKMRETDEAGANPTQHIGVEFCFLCQFLIVDQIDPSVHPVIDRSYPGGIP